jgi:RNA-directed DNA polymerase
MNMYLEKETLTRHVGLDKLMQTSLQGIEQKAKQNKKHKFSNLYGLLNEQALGYAWKSINKKASAGVDKITAEEYAENLTKNINEIVDALKNKRYHAKLIKRVEIPKGNGKKRPLGIPSVSDKILQNAVTMILKAIYEPEFLESSYGYRPNVGAGMAVKDLTKELQFSKYSFIVEADINGFFDNINHDWLIKMLEYKINDRAFIGLIKKWLKAGILDTDGLVKHPVTGCPQGGIISPTLSNIYLHYVLDLWFEKIVKSKSQGEAYICRYCDDFVCAFRYKGDAEKFYNQLPKRLRKFELQLSIEKTNIISFTRFRKQEKTYFEFLGFEYRWGVSALGKDIIKRRTSRNKLRQSLSNMKNWCKGIRSKRLVAIIKLLNSKLRGYYNYYGVIGNSKDLNGFYRITMETLYKWQNRRSQRRSFNWIEFKKMIKRYGVITPRITENTNHQIKFDICFV